MAVSIKADRQHWSQAWCDLTGVTATRDTAGGYPSRKYSFVSRCYQPPQPSCSSCLTCRDTAANSFHLSHLQVIWRTDRDWYCTDENYLYLQGSLLFSKQPISMDSERLFLELEIHFTECTTSLFSFAFNLLAG